uniref:Putative salivary secreted peptide n=1 Tax=Ixodes ricinus TaxID=34613 RepID=A0A090X893_IXORI
MKVYLVKIAVILTVMSFIFCTEVFDSSAASEESGSMEFPKAASILQCLVGRPGKDIQLHLRKIQTKRPFQKMQEKRKTIYYIRLIFCGKK